MNKLIFIIFITIAMVALTNNYSSAFIYHSCKEDSCIGYPGFQYEGPFQLIAPIIASYYPLIYDTIKIVYFKSDDDCYWYDFHFVIEKVIWVKRDGATPPPLSTVLKNAQKQLLLYAWHIFRWPKVGVNSKIWWQLW